LPELGVGAVKNPEDRFTCFGAIYKEGIYATAIWSAPAARLLPAKTWLELRRLAVGPGAPRNTPSRMLAVMTRILRKDRPDLERLVSYQDTQAHSGAIYRAAGWVPGRTDPGRQWDTPSRRRPPNQTKAPRRRWEMVLRPGSSPGQ
jgi:hypothetical protein